MTEGSACRSLQGQDDTRQEWQQISAETGSKVPHTMV
jgi:hypothetical protein